METLEKISTIWTILGIPVTVGAVFVGRFWPRIRFWLYRRFMRDKGEGVILCVYKQRKETDPKKNVNDFIDNEKALHNIPDSRRVFVPTPERYDGAALDGIVEQVRSELGKVLKASGSTSLHVFMDTTIVLGCKILTPYYNVVRIHMYQWDHVTYQYQGTLAS